MFERSRLSLARWFTLSMGGILVLFAGLLYVREARDRLRTFDQALYTTGQVISSGVEEISHGDRRRIDLEDAPLLGSDAIRIDTSIVLARWYTPEKTLMQFMGPIPPPTLEDDLGFQTVLDPASARQLRQLTLPVYRDGQILGYLQVAAGLDPVVQPLQNLRWFLALGVPAALGAIAAVGWGLGGMAMQPIRAAYQRLQQFTADASHELRAPLAAIVSHAQLGLMEPTSPQEQTACLQTISEVGEGMSTLVGRLLFLARHQGQQPWQIGPPIDLVAILTPLVADYSAVMAAQNLTFTATLPPAPLWLRAEPDLLRQALINLLDNARRYTPAGGTVALRGEVQHRWVVLRVEDSGIGIAAADLPHIFERFYRVSPERSRQSGGVGLGLAIVQQIIALHGGQIQVSSQPQVGTQFEIRLPLATPPRQFPKRP
ncbi:sensor histidine kinase [Phormidium tenue]|uniref:histidine kinase n=1 Tax=Phormidium tenue NIES-30 TaxID=549789 RepID=A0A1U7IZB1_9CYAN|nr:HAMP domain-containing sensor histidine kinase [Phormidium tenue]MBD2234501.1 HAMP domain-containing histidine kinase [Phormidium tenue FACHB-1052]OKH44410.1 two-component sensor histidine kinase [Phormidium tenue NIES-30]